MRGKGVVLMSAAIDEVDSDIVFRGRLSAETLGEILVDEYQREVLQQSKIDEIAEAFKAGANVPDVDLSMRGGSFDTARDGHIVLRNTVYVVDGLQRISAARQFVQNGGVPRLGAMVHCNKDKAWEMARFATLNTSQHRLAANVLIRNMRDTLPSIATLYSMSENDASFVLRNRICWQQSQNRAHLLSATTFVRAVGTLHTHLCVATNVSGALRSARSMERLMSAIGKTTFRSNIRTFFDVIDACWGLRTVTYKGHAPQLKYGFMISLARVFSDHTAFWSDTEEKKFFVSKPLLAKLKTFPINDPEVRNLASAAGTARILLYQLFVNHINSGKRTNRLKKRAIADEATEDALAEASEE